MGDPAGIGPEVCCRLILDPLVVETCTPLILGDYVALAKSAEELALNLDSINVVARYQAAEHLTVPTIVDFETPDIEKIPRAIESAQAGHAAWAYIEQAIKWSVSNQIDAVTTGPINKKSISLAGKKFPGHTEIFATKTNTEKFCMMQYSDEVTCAFVTTHVGYGDVLDELTTERILDVIELAAEAIARIENRKPTLMVCGLNPHAGEQGLFGNREEERLIQPAVDQALSRGIDASGPFPPDTCFIPTNRSKTDCYICMYHDQGHIPLKALAFDRAVNVTLGLPVIRTSVDHGTAFDIVGQGVADSNSLVQAVLLAARLACPVSSLDSR